MTVDTEDLGGSAKPEAGVRSSSQLVVVEAGQAAAVSEAELRALLDALDSERLAREEAEQKATLFGDQSDRFERLFLAEQKRVEAAQRREREARALLGQAGLQIARLHEKFGETSSGNAVLVRIRRLAKD